MRKNILFVGETQPLWRDFQAFCRAPECAWSAEFAACGLDGLGLVGQKDYQAIVSDVQLLDMRGADFLDETMRWQPRSCRIILSDMADTAGTVQCLGKSHRHLLKPCDTSMLLSVLNDALMREAWAPAQRALSLVARLRKVPSPPAVYFRIASEMQSPEASVEVVGNLIGEDPSLAAKILQLANSAVFGLRMQVSDPAEAVNYLGLETTRALVLLAHSFASFERGPIRGFSIDRLCHHSVCVGRFAQRIMQLEGSSSEVTEQVSAAGLLHDVGRLVFAANMPSLYEQAVAVATEEKRPFWEIETRLLGASHAEVGGCLLNIWGLPRPMLEAVTNHHTPFDTHAELTPALVLCAANLLAHEAWPDNQSLPRECRDDGCFLKPELSARLDVWRQACLGAQASAHRG